MTDPITIRMGGYGPPTTGFSRALKLIGDTLAAEFGDRIDVKYVWNIMDFGYRAEDILWLVEDGVLTLGYQSSSYLTDRVPELGFVDLPFLFEKRDQARAAMDGALGRFLGDKIEAARELSHPRLVRERLSPDLEPPAHRAHAARTSRTCASACCRARSRRAPSSSSAASRCAWI